MRLIDADALKKYIMGYASKPTYTQALYLKAIEEQPTAYSIENIVAELEEKKQNALEVEESIKEYNVWNDAIEIVKQGGVSDDVCEWKLEDEEANLHLTGCQQRQLIFEGTPKENGYRYCPYCGKKIKAVE